VKVYSPSQVESWFRCPTLWQLQRRGWRLKMMGKPDRAQILGNGIMAGVNIHYQQRFLNHAAGVTPQQCAKATVDAEINERQRVQGWLPGEEPLVTAALAAKTVEKYIAKDPLPKGYKVVHIEQILPESGNSRIDFGVVSPYDQPEVWDLKTKNTLDARYLNKTFEQFRYSWQMYHYVHFYGKMLGRPIHQFVIVLVVADPFKVYIDPVPVDAELQTKWFNDAQSVWATMERMERGELEAWQAPDHYDNYGRCKFWDACTNSRLHEELMVGNYIKVEREAQ
jgi:hypothetical protein